ncbi:unnamed protein product [Rotaria sordida]|uniref:Dihydrolipoyllysine-residue succinyltransferase component of 2-oxoglutarate dehydrogenase complex, mitochondrial n=1 Tax=Rotaria sordida TaxID=392033 RepID=A0A815TCS1_9BILA|nr:unnamed protein product [Rotaria sordida]CAF1494314.1 unnamed protein product [Rotaria sordida]CAF1504105.1 unnamed protein product [Rotaria sordida]
MSHIVSLRSASLRALRSNSTTRIVVAAATKSTTYPHRTNLHQQQCSFSAISQSATRILSAEQDRFKKRTLSDQTFVIDTPHANVYALNRCLHTSSILFESIKVPTPSFPESVKDGTIRFLKKVGDKVSADETIAEIETDKTNLSVNAPTGGTIESLLVNEGDNVTSGAQVAVINTSGDAAKPTSAAKKGSLAIEDMDGGTFTISNGGVFGSLFGTPIINPPQSAILGMHGVFDRPVVVGGKIEIRPMMYVALTYDHRILDGRDAVLFLRKIKQYIEDSRSIFLEL